MKSRFESYCPNGDVGHPPVRYANAAGAERVVSIVGTDEVDLNRNHISFVSPLGRALMKSAAGDEVVLQAPGGTEYLTVLEVCYQRIAVEPFREPAGAESSARLIQLTRLMSVIACFLQLTSALETSKLLA